MIFDVDYSTEVKKLSPPELRSGSLMSWFASLVNPLQTLIDTVAKPFETDVKKRAKFNAQIMVLAAALNNILAVTGIRVVTNQSLAYNTFVFNESEGIDVYSYNESETQSPIFTFNEAEPVDAYDFTIQIPSGIYTTEVGRRIRAEVTTYKLAGKSFNIVTY